MNKLSGNTWILYSPCHGICIFVFSVTIETSSGESLLSLYISLLVLYSYMYVSLCLSTSYLFLPPTSLVDGSCNPFCAQVYFLFHVSPKCTFLLQEVSKSECLLPSFTLPSPSVPVENFRRNRSGPLIPW